MGDVIDMQERAREKWAGQGEVNFLTCGCGSEMGLLPVILHDAGPPLVVALVCPDCENEVPVLNGRLCTDVPTGN